MFSNCSYIIALNISEGGYRKMPVFTDMPLNDHAPCNFYNDYLSSMSRNQLNYHDII